MVRIAELKSWPYPAVPPTDPSDVSNASATGAYHHMTQILIHRVWRLSVTLGPLVAIALTLAAGRRWN